MAERFKQKKRPPGIPTGKNMMTPEVLFYALQKVGEEWAHIEVSKGDFLQKDIYGVTIRKANGENFDPKLSQGGFGSLDEAIAYLDSL